MFPCTLPADLKQGQFANHREFCLTGAQQSLISSFRDKQARGVSLGFLDHQRAEVFRSPVLKRAHVTPSATCTLLLRIGLQEHDLPRISAWRRLSREIVSRIPRTRRQRPDRSEGWGDSCLRLGNCPVITMVTLIAIVAISGSPRTAETAEPETSVPGATAENTEP
jgi:hypothetical protein